MIPKNYLSVFLILFANIIYAQIGIGTTTPNSSLDIRSTNQASPSNTDGILIPKIDVFPITNPTAAQQGMLVYLTTAVGANQPGFYYWDNGSTSWYGIASGGGNDKDWYEEGTTTAPNAITDEMFHTGNVAIGKNTTDYPLEVNTTSFDKGIVNTFSSTATNGIEKYGFQNELTIDSDDETSSFKTNLSGIGNGNQYGSSNSISNTGGGSHFGVNNSLSGTGFGAQIGVFNEITNSSVGTHYGSYNYLDGSGAGFHYGMYNNITGIGDGLQTGVHTIINNGGTGTHTGIYNDLLGTSDGEQHGIDNLIGNSGNGIHYGTRSFLNGTGTGIHFGNYAKLEGMGAGIQYASYNEITNIGAASHYGTYNILSGPASGTQYGNYTTITNSSNGNHFGSDFLLNGTGSGTHTAYSAYLTGAGTGGQYGNSISIDNSGNSTHYGTINRLGGGGSGEHYATKNLIIGSGTGIQYGVHNEISNSGSAIHYGNYSNLLGSGGGDQYGNYNNINNTGIGNHYGTYNDLSGTGLGTQYGNYTSITNTGMNTQYGSYTVLSSNGFGGHTGNYNLLSGGSGGVQTGTYNEITNTAGSSHFGAVSLLTGSGAATKYGFYADLNAGAGGTHYGVYSQVLKAGATNFAGYFLGNVGIGTAAGNIYTLPPSRGTNNQVMITNGAGVLTWQNSSNIQGHAWYEVGTTIAPDAITDAMFHTGNVSIGKNTNTYPLDVTSAISTAQIVTTSGTNSALSAINNAASGTGGGNGVYGQTSQSAGFGSSSANLNASGTGLVGAGNGGAFNYLTAGSGGAFTGTATGLYVRSSTSGIGQAIFTDQFGTACRVNYWNGTTQYKILGTGTVSTTAEGLNNERVTLHCTEAPEIYFEDYGQSQLVDGKIHIEIDPIIAKNILVNEKHPLRVYIQLEDNCNGVFVTNKTGNSFDVVELSNGQSNAKFQYHIVGNRADEVLPNGRVSKNADTRFELAPENLLTKEVNPVKGASN